MLSRPFTKFEKILLLILVVLLLGLTYYLFVYSPVQKRIKAADTTLIEDQIQTELQKAYIIKSMKEEVDDSQKNLSGVVATYDNFKSEAAFLNTIFVPLAETYNYNFQTPEASGDTVRRTITISFTASDYQVARKIIQMIHDSKYRCMMNDISISATADSSGGYVSLKTNSIRCSVNVTFYETLIGAGSTAGLKIEGEKTESDYIGLGSADFSKLERNSLETIAESIAAS